jgi:hypothetical protein
VREAAGRVRLLAGFCANSKRFHDGLITQWYGGCAATMRYSDCGWILPALAEMALEFHGLLQSGEGVDSTLAVWAVHMV